MQLNYKSLYVSLILSIASIFGLSSCFENDQDRESMQSTEKKIAVDDAIKKPSQGKAATPKVSTDSYSDWVLECYDPRINEVSCQVIQRIIHNETEQNVLVVSLVYNEERQQDIIQIVLPVDFDLTAGVLIEIGDYQEVINVNRCNANGCYIEGGIDGLSSALIAASEEEMGRFVIGVPDGNKIAIPFSPKGFSLAYEEMKRRN